MHSVQFPLACRVDYLIMLNRCLFRNLGPVNFRLVIFRHIKGCNSASVKATAFKLSGMEDESYLYRRTTRFCLKYDG